MRRGHRQSNCSEEKSEHPANCPDDMSFFPWSPDFSGVRGRSSAVPRLELIVNRNVEHERDGIAYCDRDSRAQDNLEFSAITSITHHDQPQEWCRDGDGRQRRQGPQIVDVNDLLELNEAGRIHRRASKRRSKPISEK